MVKIQITEEEWTEASSQVRSQILELMVNLGYDITALQEFQRLIDGSPPQDTYNQFYGDEE